MVSEFLLVVGAWRVGILNYPLSLTHISPLHHLLFCLAREISQPDCSKILQYMVGNWYMVKYLIFTLMLYFLV